MPPSVYALFSSGVPLARLLEANFAVSGFMLTMAKWPLLSNIAKPVPWAPNTSVFLPSGLMLTFEAMVQVPTRSLAVWATAAPGKTTQMPSAIAFSAMFRVMVFSLGCLRRFRVQAGPCYTDVKAYSRQVASLCPRRDHEQSTALHRCRCCRLDDRVRRHERVARQARADRRRQRREGRLQRRRHVHIQRAWKGHRVDHRHRHRSARTEDHRQPAADELRLRPARQPGDHARRKPRAGRELDGRAA